MCSLLALYNIKWILTAYLRKYAFHKIKNKSFVIVCPFNCVNWTLGLCHILKTHIIIPFKGTKFEEIIFRNIILPDDIIEILPRIGLICEKSSQLLAC